MSSSRHIIESTGKEGVYYVLPFPTRWRLYSFPWEDFGDLWHGDAWRGFVIDDLAAAWAAKLQVAMVKLRAQLVPLWKGVPRGRVERSAVMEYVIFHADDLGETGISKDRIMMAFQLIGAKVTWSLDPHEEQNPAQRVALRDLLKLDTSNV
jgi:hypothetical protein